MRRGCQLQNVRLERLGTTLDIETEVRPGFSDRLIELRARIAADSILQPVDAGIQPANGGTSEPDVVEEVTDNFSQRSDRMSIPRYTADEELERTRTKVKTEPLLGKLPAYKQDLPKARDDGGEAFEADILYKSKSKSSG